MWPGAAIVLVAAVLPAAGPAARRNAAYLRLLHGGDAAPSSTSGSRADDLLRLRAAMQKNDWTTASQMLARTADPGRLAPLVVIHEADRRLKNGDRDGALAALAVARDQPGHDSVVCYRLGEGYERAHAPDEAVNAYARGAAVDPAAPWAEGSYRIAMIYQAQQKWQRLADLLGPLLAAAGDQDIARTVESDQTGGAVWQGAFLPLGLAYERLGRAAEAERIYDRVARIASPRRDWTLNRALVYLARLRRGRGDLLSALPPLVRALDLSTEYDPSFRRTYELDTAAEAERLLDQASRDGRLREVQAAVSDMSRQPSQSPAAWYLQGLAMEAACDVAGARAAYARAAALLPAGAGSFLTGRPHETAKGACGTR